MKGKFLTDRGQIRSHNEDSGGTYDNPHGQFLAIIADGMGGHKAGDVASQMATSIIQEKWQNINYFNTPEDTEKWLEETIQKMNKTIYEKAQLDKQCKGMGTTIVVSVCSNDFVTIAHIGDSRCYLFNEDGFAQITEDHSLVNELIRSGQISEQDAENHPRKNVLLKALGTEEYIAADIKSFSWNVGDKLLLCSDGLTNKLSDNELVEFLQLNHGIEEVGN